MTQKTVFVSNVSFADAVQQAQQAGYVPVGQARNNRGQFVVFARASAQQHQQFLGDKMKQGFGVSSGDDLASKIY